MQKMAPFIRKTLQADNFWVITTNGEENDVSTLYSQETRSRIVILH